MSYCILLPSTPHLEFGWNIATLSGQISTEWKGVRLFCSHCSSIGTFLQMALCGNSSLGSATMWVWSVFPRSPCWRTGVYLESISGGEWIRRVLTCSITSSVDVFINWWCYWKMMKTKENLGGRGGCGGWTFKNTFGPQICPLSSWPLSVSVFLLPATMG